MWFEERVQKTYKPKRPKFPLCCSYGRVVLPSYEYPPNPLDELFYRDDHRSKYFQSNIRSFNSMFAFTSMGGNIIREVNNGTGPPVFVMHGENYHQIGSLLPHPGARPKFAQLYIYDTENEVQNRMAAVR